ncbi:Na/Pi symporter [Bacteriovoracaceae bacterium]|nr:Na/Pi symporter [Bacteriovoracaceae bacterium]
MKEFEIIIAAISSIILFIFGLDHFSIELQKITGEKFRKILGKLTTVPVIGLLLGAITTSIIQSSSATSVITISLVNSGVLSFKNSIGIIFGANIGTTVTAQLIAFKLTAFAPIIIIFGFLLSFVKSRYSIFAKSLFYFGFVFFTLNLISSSMSPFQNDPRVVSYLTAPLGPMLAILIGFVITAIVQSSSVTTGLAIILTQQGLMSLDNAIPVLMGANIGTSVTALLSIFNMDIAAKKTALAHLFFNIGGVIITLPILYLNKDILIFSSDPAIALANFHLVFNLSTGLIFLMVIKPFTKLIDALLSDGKMDFERFDFDFFKEEHTFEEIEKELLLIEDRIYDFIQENYSLVTLSLETNYKKILETVTKRMDYFNFVKKDIQSNFTHLLGATADKKQVKRYVLLMNQYEYLFQIDDSIRDHISIKELLDTNYIEMKSDVLISLRELTGQLLPYFTWTKDASNGIKTNKEFKEESQNVQEEVDHFRESILKLMAKEERNDAGVLYNLGSYSQRLKDKLINYQKIKIQYKVKTDE